MHKQLHSLPFLYDSQSQNKLHMHHQNASVNCERRMIFTICSYSTILYHQHTTNCNNSEERERGSEGKIPGSVTRYLIAIGQWNHNSA